MRIRSFAVAAFSFLLTRSLPAAADEPAHVDGSAPDRTEPSTTSKAVLLGRRGQVIIMNDAQIDMRRWVYPGATGVSSFTFAPSIDYLLTDHVTVGAAVGVTAFRFGADNDELHFSITPRLGFIVPIVGGLSIWPNVTGTFSKGTGDGMSSQAWSTSVAAPVLAELAPHFFVGAGPVARWTDINDYVYASYGLTTMLGGWL